MPPHLRAASRACVALGLLVVSACATGGHGNAFVPPSRPAEFSLAGIPWGIAADSVSELMSPRGYNYNKTDDDGDLWYDGILYRVPTRVYAFMSQQKLVKFRVVINTPDDDAVTMYHKVRAELVKQYGQPKETIEEYEKPYAAGDHKQVQAFRDKKAAMRSYWLPSGRTSLIAVAVSENLAVIVDYEGSAWDKESVRRRQHGR